MDILYIVKGGAVGGTDVELRCSLRSIAKHGRGIGRVFVAGGCPAWLSDAVTCIPYQQPDVITFPDKGRNIARTTLYALEHSDIGEDFLVSMDDHFYMQDVDFEHYPYYCRGGAGFENGELPQEGSFAGGYREYLAQSRAFLEARGLPVKCMALHRNMHCSRRWIEGAWDAVEDVLTGRGVCEIWVLLNNWAIANEGIIPTIVEDCKVNDRREWTTRQFGQVFSTGDFRRGSWMYKALLDTFPEKSIYERD